MGGPRSYEKYARFFILLCCLFLGHFVSEVLPGPECAMGLFLAALISGVVDEEIIDEACGNLRRVNLFFPWW